MENFEINFSQPWLLLLLIPALFFTLLPYFRLSKKYRKTRNRITSMVLHMLVMLCSIFALAGLRFDYEIPNDQNEIILLVDVSESEEQAQEARDEFVELVINDSRYDGFNIGIVTFGFDQQYAVPLTNKTSGVFDAYISAPLPDTSATNVAAALNYAKTLFNNPKTGKIVLITDGKETDEDAKAVISSIAVQGIKVDTAYVSSKYEGNDVQVVGITLPEYHVDVEDETTIVAMIQSSSDVSATIELLDNGVVNEELGKRTIDLTKGTHSVEFTHVFAKEGLHELSVKIKVDGDLLEQNNEYATYLNLEFYNKILIIERAAGTSIELENLLNADLAENKKYKIDVKDLKDATLPSTVEGLRAYDQVILNNISYKELESLPCTDEESFDLALEKYVQDFGGGLFTVGGDDEDGKVNAYQNMTNTVYQSMLPVQAIKYTPPVGVMLVIDTSGSMQGNLSNGTVKLDAAKNGAGACLDALTDRDYVGVMKLDTAYDMVLELTPRSQESKIKQAIYEIKDTTGGTEYTAAIVRAAEALRSLKSVAKRHIIIISDGEISDHTNSINMAKGYYETDGITLSVVNILHSADSSPNAMIEELVKVANGKSYVASSEEALIQQIKTDLNAPSIEDVNIPEGGFNPIVYDDLSPLVTDLERLEGDGHNKLTVALDGFYGSKIKADAELILVGDYEVPIYAQWKYGKGMVGSFMCDLNGKMSKTFIKDKNAQLFVRNVVKNLMPLENIRPNPITMSLKSDNYSNQLSVLAGLKTEAGERVEGKIIKMENSEEGSVFSMNETTVAPDGTLLADLPCYVSVPLSANNHYSRCSFVIKQSGVYKIVLTKYNADGTVSATLTSYKSFAYSEEYDTFVEETEEDLKAKLETLSARGGGVSVQDLENPKEIFEGFVTATKQSFDPRMILMITAIVLFLLDIAVRKFKFKWPHELIREYKKKKNGEL